jgi:hypothetical protein
METVAVAGLVGLGYIVSRLANKSSEGFNDNSQDYGMFKSGSQTVARRGPTESFIDRTSQGANPVGHNPELDLQYKLPNGQTLPSTPNPTPYGLPLGYSTQQVPLANPTPQGDLLPKPTCLEDQTAQVCINPSNLEQNPVYVDGDVVSSLSGQNIQACDFRHNNMFPFFGGRVKQNVRPNVNNSILDTFTGSGATQIKKQEVETN